MSQIETRTIVLGAVRAWVAAFLAVALVTAVIGCDSGAEPSPPRAARDRQANTEQVHVRAGPQAEVTLDSSKLTVLDGDTLLYGGETIHASPVADGSHNRLCQKGSGRARSPS